MINRSISAIITAFTPSLREMYSQNPVFIPAPTNIPDQFHHAMQAQIPGHRAPDCVKKCASALENLNRVFKPSKGSAASFSATLKMAMADLNYTIALGSGMAVALDSICQPRKFGLTLAG